MSDPMLQMDHSPIVLPKVSIEGRYRAAIETCKRAVDIAEAREFLLMLGLVVER